MIDDLERVLRTFDPVVQECRDLLLQRSRSTAAWLKECPDGSTEWVTELDRLVERKIGSVIRTAYPDAGLVAEEFSPDPAALNQEYCFVVDPIDGTNELVAGRDGYSISIALLQRRRPIVGLLDFPARGQRFHSIRGQKTVVNGEVAEVSSFVPGTRPLRVAVSPGQAGNPRWANFAGALTGLSLIPTGALGSKVARVATGEFDAAFFLDWEGSRTPVWDFAAAGLILEGAGGQFTSLDGSSLIDELPAMHRGGWVASNRECHEKLLLQIQGRKETRGGVGDYFSK